MSDPSCVLCGGLDAELCETVAARPTREVDYGIPADRYGRRIMRCATCRVFFNDHELLPEQFYGGAYNEAAYGERFRARYDAVMALPREKSDNKQRALRLDRWLRDAGRAPASTRVLDVGSGLGVFPAEMIRLGYEAHVIDPDPMSVKHAIEVVGVADASVGSLENLPAVPPADLVTLNKVLEHVTAPVRDLRAAAALVAPGGFIYVELPDGEAAAEAGGFVDRSEFFVEHFTAYGPASLRWLVENAGLAVRQLDRLHEPSDKYTIYAIAGQGDRA
jgi:SAM-dependent methyltransferase